MPIYGYRCSACGHELEIQQKMSDKPLTACPKCGGKLNKLMYPVGISFKGSGFYTTDYKSSGASSSNGASGASESASESKTESKSESKSDPKSDSKSESKSKSKPEFKSEKAS